MANYYFWGDTDGDWECGAGNNWRDAANGGGSPIVGQPGAGDDIYIEDNQECTTNADHSATVFQTLNIESGATLVVANGGDVRFGTDNASVVGTLKSETGGTVTLTDIDVAMDGELAFDGGALNLTTTTTTAKNINVSGTITGTANGGTINLSCTTVERANIVLDTDDANLVGNAASPILIVCDVGAAAGYLNTTIERGLWQNCEIRDPSRVNIANGTAIFDNVAIKGVNTTVANGISIANSFVELRDVSIDKCTNGIYVNVGEVIGVNCLLGTNTANTKDIYCNQNVSGRFHNSVFASATELDSSIQTTWGVVHSTAHDQDAEKSKTWLFHADILHVIESEFTIVQAGRQSIKMATHANTSSTALTRCEYPLAAWPATHGDTLDVTIYVRGQSGDKIQVHVDPESHYGTTQTTEHTQSVNDTWELVTVAQYTVNTNADEKMGIPIVIRCEEASKTWYIDTLAVT